MTDQYTQRLSEASFKGVVFRVRSEDLPSGGRKTALHDFPNSDQRFIEDMGEIPPRFTISAFVHGLDWIERAQALENALRTAGPGRLVMPTFGAFTVWALPYSKSASQTSIGEIEFKLEFATSRAVAGILETKPTAEKVFAAGDTVRGKIAHAFSKLFKLPKDALGYLSSLSDVRSAVTGAIASVSNLMAAGSMSELLSAATGLLGNAGTLLTEPFNMALEFFGIEEGSSGIWQIISEGMDSLGSVNVLLDYARQFGNDLALIQSDFDSGSKVSPVPDSPPSPPVIPGEPAEPPPPNISLWAATTEDRIDRNDVRTVIVESNRLAALVVAYEQAANADYSTIEQVQEVRESLEDVFSEMMRVDAQNVNSVMADREVRTAMDTLRISALAVLDQKAQSSWLISQITRVAGVSASNLAYLLYAESMTSSADLDERAIQVRGLNRSKPAIAINGDINVMRGLNA